MNCCDENKVIRSEEDKKNLINRISRISGQVDGVKKMIENDNFHLKVTYLIIEKLK